MVWGMSWGQFSNYNSIFLARLDLGGEAGSFGPSREGMGPKRRPT